MQRRDQITISLTFMDLWYVNVTVTGLYLVIMSDVFAFLPLKPDTEGGSATPLKQVTTIASRLDLRASETVLRTAVKLL